MTDLTEDLTKVDLTKNMESSNEHTSIQEEGKRRKLNTITTKELKINTGGRKRPPPLLKSSSENRVLNIKDKINKQGNPYRQPANWTARRQLHINTQTTYKNSEISQKLKIKTSFTPKTQIKTNRLGLKIELPNSVSLPHEGKELQHSTSFPTKLKIPKNSNTLKESQSFSPSMLAMKISPNHQVSPLHPFNLSSPLSQHGSTTNHSLESPQVVVTPVEDSDDDIEDEFKNGYDLVIHEEDEDERSADHASHRSNVTEDSIVSYQSKKKKTKDTKKKTSIVQRLLQGIRQCLPINKTKPVQERKKSKNIRIDTYIMKTEKKKKIPTLPLSTTSSGLRTPPVPYSGRSNGNLSSRNHHLGQLSSRSLTPSQSSQSLAVMEDFETIGDLAQTDNSLVSIGRSPSVTGLVLVKQQSQSLLSARSSAPTSCETPPDLLKPGSAWTEFEISSRLVHAHIATVYGQDIESKAIYAKFYPESLHDLISRQGALSVADTRRMTNQLLSAVHYLHESAQFMHGDIKSQNILLSEHQEIKLSDFGAGRYMGNEDLINVPVNEMAMGTKLFSAPELIVEYFPSCETSTSASTPDDVTSDTESDDDFYDMPSMCYRLSKVSDIWSVGLVVYEMMVGIQAFDEIAKGCQTEFDILMRLKSQFDQKPILDCSPIEDDLARDFVETCLDPNPKTRPTVTDMMRHPFVSRDQ